MERTDAAYGQPEKHNAFADTVKSPNVILSFLNPSTNFLIMGFAPFTRAVRRQYPKVRSHLG